MKNCIVSSIAETNIITAPTTTSRLRIKFVAGITYHPACYYLSKRDFHVHGSLVAFSKRRYECMCVNERTKSGGKMERGTSFIDTLSMKNHHLEYSRWMIEDLEKYEHYARWTMERAVRATQMIRWKQRYRNVSLSAPKVSPRQWLIDRQWPPLIPTAEYDHSSSVR